MRLFSLRAVAFSLILAPVLGAAPLQAQVPPAPSPGAPLMAPDPPAPPMPPMDQPTPSDAKTTKSAAPSATKRAVPSESAKAKPTTHPKETTGKARGSARHGAASRRVGTRPHRGAVPTKTRRRH